MSKPIRWVAIAAVVIIVLGGGVWASRGMILDSAADEVAKKFQVATCDQLKAQKDESPTAMKKAVLWFLHDDPQARVAFIDKIAAPVLNKMIECGMAP
jgi:hypothetical protein